ncbi:MAG TPA: hypothetical protein VI756_27855 [Blastocatellia bacterium]
MKNIGFFELAGFCGLLLAILTAPLKAEPGQHMDAVTGDNSANEPPLACNLNALDAEQRLRVHALVAELRSGIQQVKELPDGYAMRLSTDASNISKLGEYVSLERLCCPFFDFVIQAEREDGPVLITLTGREGVKDLARAEFSLTGTCLRHTGAEVASSQAESPLICNDGALTAAQLARLIQLIHEIRAAKKEIKELPDGYAVRLSASSSLIRDVTEYMSILRICSPYFETRLEVTRQSGPVWLTMTGRQGVKSLTKIELGI